MAGILTTVRENWAAFLRDDVASGAAAFFAYDPAIPIYTEKLKSIEQVVTDALKRLALSVVLVTVEAKDAKNQRDGLRFGKITAGARVFENPKINRTGVSASDLAECIAVFTRKFTVFGVAMQLQDISLGNDPRALAYDVIYTIEAGQTASILRNDYLVDELGNHLVDQDGNRIVTNEILTAPE